MDEKEKNINESESQNLQDSNMQDFGILENNTTNSNILGDELDNINLDFNKDENNKTQFETDISLNTETNFENLDENNIKNDDNFKTSDFGIKQEQEIKEDVFKQESFENNDSLLLNESSIEQNTLQDDIEEIKNNDLITVRPVKFQRFDNEVKNNTIKKNIDILQDVTLNLKVELGKTKSTIRDVMDYEKSSIVELDKIAGEQVEIYANDKLIARGEVIVIEDYFGVRVTTTNVGKS